MEEVYRLMKAKDASSISSQDRRIPRQSQFSNNDVIILTRQPKGVGDIFGPSSNPTSRDATKVEARVIGTGPSYIDIAMSGGSFEATFGPAPNNYGDRGDPNLRLRVDRFFSVIPFNRMMNALGQITALSEKVEDRKSEVKDETKKQQAQASKGLDPALREVVVSTFGHGDDTYPAPDADLQALAKKLAQAPFRSSSRLTNEVLKFIQANPRRIFSPFNEPQLTAIGAALSRRFTMIQGMVKLVHILVW